MSLRYVPQAELERIRSLDADPPARAGAFADACRINALYMIARAARGTSGRASAAWTSLGLAPAAAPASPQRLISTRHSKLAPGSLEQAKVGVKSSVAPVGAESIAV